MQVSSSLVKRGMIVACEVLIVKNVKYNPVIRSGVCWRSFILRSFAVDCLMMSLQDMPICAYCASALKRFGVQAFALNCFFVRLFCIFKHLPS